MTLLKYFIYLLPLLLFVVITTSSELKERELGSRYNPIRLYFTPSVDAKTITTNAKELTAFLEAETGYYFVTAVPSSFIAVVEAFGTKKADIAIINTFSYLMSNEKYGAQALLRVVRRGGQTSYKGQIITQVDSGIDSIQDLEGKKMAYVDPSSTSGYILPKFLLMQKGIQPSDETFAMKHDNVVTMVYQGQVDAGATFYSPPDPVTGQMLDARMRVLQQFPDVEKKIKIIAFTPEIPNDPVVFRKDLPQEMKDKVVNALLKFVSTPEGVKALGRIYSVEGLVKTTDADYDILRQMLAEQEIALEEMLNK